MLTFCLFGFGLLFAFSKFQIVEQVYMYDKVVSQQQYEKPNSSKIPPELLT